MGDSISVFPRHKDHMMINHFNIQRVHLSLRECLCSCNMGVIIMTKLQIEILIKLKKACVILSMGEGGGSRHPS